VESEVMKLSEEIRIHSLVLDGKKLFEFQLLKRALLEWVVEIQKVAIMINTYREHSFLIMTMTLVSDINDFVQGSDRWRENKLLV